MVEGMATELPYLQMTTPERKKLVGKQQKGTRMYRREGTFKESGEWCVAMDKEFEDQFVSPGGVCMFVPVSRAAVHKLSLIHIFQARYNAAGHNDAKGELHDARRR